MEIKQIAKIDFSLPVLSIRQPWPWLILNAGKDIENRDWCTKYRGRFNIHASKGMKVDEYWDAKDFAQRLGFTIPGYNDLQRGGIIGSAELVDCVTQSPSKWFFGKYGFVLRDPQSHTFYPCKGQLGFFKVKP